MSVSSPATKASPTPSYLICGRITGLKGTLVLSDNGKDNLSISTNGSFNFSTNLANLKTYSITLVTQPTLQYCSISNGSGSVSGANVTQVAITCLNSGISNWAATVLTETSPNASYMESVATD